MKTAAKHKPDIKYSPEAYFSTNYTKFKFGPNRKIKESHVQRISESIAKRGFIPQFRILVSTKNFVIDGAHRVLGSQRAQKGFYYEYCDLSTDLIALLNSLQLKWKTTDFIDFYAHEGKKSYTQLQNVLALYKDFSIASIISILKSMNSNIKIEIEEGNFDFSNKHKFERIIDWINTFSEYTPIYKNSRFIRGFLSFYASCKNYDHNRMRNAVRKNKSRFVSGNETIFYKTIFQEIY